MTRSRLWPMLVTPTLLLSLAACGGDGDKSSDLPTSVPSSSNTPSTPPPSTVATPTPSSEPTRTMTKYGDLTLDLRRPAKDDAKAQPAVARFLALHRSFAAMATGQTAPAELPTIATRSVIQTLNDLLAPQRKAKERAGGTLTVRVTAAQASASIAIVEGCFDQSKLVMIRPDGSRYVDATVKKSPTAVVRVTVSAPSGHWQVSEFSLKGKTC